MKSSNNINKKGLSALIMATFLFSLFGVFTRIISNQMGAFYQLTSRVFIMSVIFLIIGLISHSLTKIQKKDLPLLLLRGILILCDFFSFYTAVNNLPLGLTLFLFYAASIASNFIFGFYFLKEHINLAKITGLFLAFLGLIFIYHNGLYGLKIIPSLFALLSGFCFGLTTSSSKKLTDKYSVVEVNLIAYTIAAITGLLLILLTKETVNISLPVITWLALIGFAIIGVSAFYLVLYGYNKLEAQKASLIMLAELLFVIIVGFIFYQEIPSLSVLIGGLIIIMALAIPNLDIQYFVRRGK